MKEQNKRGRGRPRSFKTPEEFYAYFEEYREWCNNNPIQQEEAIKFGKGSGELISVGKKRPLTISGFSSYMFRNYRITNTMDYLYNEKGLHDDYFGIAKAIRQEIRDEQVSGGMAGIYNASLTARLNSLSEKTTIEGGEKPLQITGMQIIDSKKDE